MEQKYTIDVFIILINILFWSKHVLHAYRVKRVKENFITSQVPFGLLKEKEKWISIFSQSVNTRPSRPSLDKSAYVAPIQPSWTAIYKSQLNLLEDNLDHHINHRFLCLIKKTKSQRREKEVKIQEENWIFYPTAAHTCG